MLNIDDFRTELIQQLWRAESRGAPFVDITSGGLHRALGDYPSSTRHRMPTCCDAMYGEKRQADDVLSRPPKGKGASLTIRYRLPR